MLPLTRVECLMSARSDPTQVIARQGLDRKAMNATTQEWIARQA